MGCNDASHILNVNVCIHILSPKPTQPTHHHQLYNTSLPIGRMFWMVISASGISASKLSNSPGRRISHVELLSQGYAFSNHKTNNSIKVYLYIYICIHACVYIIYSLKNPKLKVLPQNKNFGPYIYIYYIYIYISLQLPTFPFKNLPPIFYPPSFVFTKLPNLGQWLGSSEWLWHTMRRRSKPELWNTPRSPRSSWKEYVCPPTW